MKKIELQVIALTNSESHPGQYALVLEDVEMKRRIPVTIGAVEAQSIAMVVEKMKPVRPQTHDLFYNTLKSFGISLKEVLISEIVDNRYYAKLILVNNGKVEIVDSRTSDAVALAVRFGCPIYTYESILEQTGFTVDTEGLPVDRRGSFINFPLDELEELLEKVLLKEDYESASRIRDAISKKKMK